uniref:protein-tyrosine-phosphatase n=1 Tax=Crassostrea virginica TaxID=6565 RepID=A0A8B8BNB9_CRAVI|nr:receptor-type tyrosine-protein phosphatase alpha-like isoform X2 [Crassostrea virginica]
MRVSCMFYICRHAVCIVYTSNGDFRKLKLRFQTLKKMWTEFCVLSLLVPCASGFVNLAYTPTQKLQGTANMSQPSQKPAWSAGNAVDGNTDQELLTTCAVMDYSKTYSSVWWKVRLQKRFNVAYVVVYFRRSTIVRESGYSLYSFDDGEDFNSSYPNPQNLIFRHDPLLGCPDSTQTVTVNRLSREIVFYNTRPSNYMTNCLNDSRVKTTVEICEVKVMGCDENRFSSNQCNLECNWSCKNQNCDVFNGSCIYGCNDSNALTVDCLVCQNGQYISNRQCTLCKGHCKDRAPCNKLTGRCDNGCSNYWTGDYCDQCINGYYGNNCETECGKCLHMEVCDKKNGTCYHGCMNHFREPECAVCEDGYYNDTCSATCGKCANNKPCDKATGECGNGCKTNFEPPFCQICKPGFYNSATNCISGCGHCKNGAICDNESGRCPGECELYFAAPYCQVCEDGFYNETCSAACGKCANNAPCNNITGQCRNGCKTNFEPPLCQECQDGFYGIICNGTCGNCANGQPCDKVTGKCLNECKPHYKFPYCKVCEDRYYNKSCEAKCGNCLNNKPCDKENGNCTMGCRSHFMPPLCEVAMESQTGDSEDKPNTGAIAGGIVAAIIIIVIVGLAAFFLKRRQGVNRDPTGHFQIVSNDRKKGSKRNKYADISDNSLERFQEEHTNEALSRDDGGYYNTAEITTYIRTQDLHRVILEKNKKENNVYLDEYKRLPLGNTDKCKIGQQKENIVKNRFKTTFPYDHSRVILKEKWTDNDNDYINANFIKNCNGDKAYIAAQGPKKVTLADFWRMIWQENVKLVVMLTNIVENGKNKCTQYWPEKDKGMDVGPCKIKLLEETEYAFHTYRKFTVQQNNSNTRTIAQFHYTAWPDHGTPEELGLVQFHRAVTKKYQTGGLMLVHCSAGVGRTGTFIGLDSLLQHGRKFGRINVFEFVHKMREERMTMVQTAEQYIFLHKALLCGFQENDTVIKEDIIPTKINLLLQDSSPLNQRALYKEYKMLQTLKLTYDDKDTEDGQTTDNKAKNYDLKILPVSKYRPYLTTYIKGRNDYINAVCVPSFTAPGSFILTQYPLKDTEVDLWRLCMDHDVNALIVLGDTNEGVSWIPQKGSTSYNTPYSLTTGNTGSSISGVTQDTLVISIEDQRKELDVYYIPFGNDNAILKGVELLLEKEKQHSFTSVIMSKDGAERVGVFCVLHNVLQQLRMDKEVDIFTAVRQIQTRRPEVISKLEEYRRCYELVPVSISEDGIYANM